MKKTIALVLAMLMVLSVIPLAFAENETNQSVADGNQSVDNGGDDADDNQSIDVNGDDNQSIDVDGGVDDNQSIDVNGDDNQTNGTVGVVVVSGDVNDTDENVTDVNVTDVNVTADVNETIEIPENVTTEAGVTPDSPLWGLERAIERISLSLTFGRSAKAKKGLAHARERLMEVQAMIAAKKLAKAGEAQEAHDDIMDDVEENIAELGDGNETEELEDEIELEQELEEHEDLVQDVGRLKLKLKGLTPEQEAQVNEIVSTLGNSTSKVELQVKEKKDKTKIKIKAKGYTDEEIAAMVGQIEEAVASGKKAKIVLPGRGKAKKTTGVSVESGDDEGEGNETETNSTAKGKGKPDKGNKGKGKNKE